MPGGKWRLAVTRERLMSRVTVMDNGCWQWNRLINKGGYGTTSYRGRRCTLAHRAFYMEFVGPIPDGMTVDHTCHNRDLTCLGGPTCRHRRCVNPEHLEPTTTEVNSRRAGWARKTHCPAKHPYSPENTRINKGRRFCIACQHDKDAKRKGRRHS